MVGEGPALTAAVADVLHADADFFLQLALNGVLGRLAAFNESRNAGVDVLIALNVAGKQNPDSVQYLTPQLKPILDVTYGCMVYQEQVMQIVRDLAGYSMGRSDLVRRAMSKKKHDVMAREKEIFIHGQLDDEWNVVVPGCVRNGVSEQAAIQLFDEMTAFASYAFNKSHAAAYALVAVQTAWLKLKFPAEFMAALMTSFVERTDKIAEYVYTCKKMKIGLLPPDINQGRGEFSLSDGAQRDAVCVIQPDRTRAPADDI